MDSETPIVIGLATFRSFIVGSASYLLKHSAMLHITKINLMGRWVAPISKHLILSDNLDGMLQLTHTVMSFSFGVASGFGPLIGQVRRRANKDQRGSIHLRHATPSQSSPETDVDLVRGLRTNDIDAFETLVRLYRAQMSGAAWRVLGNEIDARDALLAACRTIDCFAGNSMPSTWLNRRTVNSSLMQLRSKRRKPEIPIADLLPGEPDKLLDAGTLTCRTSETLFEPNSSQTKPAQWSVPASRPSPHPTRPFSSYLILTSWITPRRHRS